MAELLLLIKLRPLLFELGDVLRTRVVERVLSDERGLAPLGGPPGKTFAALEDDVADVALVGR